MNVIETRLRPARRTIHAVVGLAMLCVAALIAVTAAMNSATDAVVAASGGFTGAEPPAAVLDDIDVPPAPATCSPQQLSDRAAQIALLEQERAAEAGALASVADAGLGDKLAAIRGRADVILGRIQQIDAGCPKAAAAPAPAAPVDETDEATEMMESAGPAPAERQAPDRASDTPGITCARPDLSDVDPGAAARALHELARVENRIEVRLAADHRRSVTHPGRGSDSARAAEFARHADDLTENLEDRRTTILRRAGLPAAVAATCEVLEATG